MGGTPVATKRRSQISEKGFFLACVFSLKTMTKTKTGNTTSQTGAAGAKAFFKARKKVLPLGGGW